LLPVVRNNDYHPAFAGSYSLKAVLPALVPAITYDGMEVANGTDAGLAWESLIRSGLDQPERGRIEKALRTYCGEDTLALIKLVKSLQAASILFLHNSDAIYPRRSGSYLRPSQS
jgi:hypothetical protein